MEATIILGLYWGNIGVMDKKMEATIVYLGCREYGVGYIKAQQSTN